jgi:hypothetical protein|tara:strand:- start:13090 stop:13410 length:321 start_codon:yes stop_codon:yes gene_type:complete
MSQKQNIMNSIKQLNKSNLISGVYNPNEAKTILTSIINKNINEYKLQYMRNWEQDHTINQQVLDDKIIELTQKKKNFEKIVKEANAGGYSICLDEVVELKLIKAIS